MQFLSLRTRFLLNALVQISLPVGEAAVLLGPFLLLLVARGRFDGFTLVAVVAAAAAATTATTTLASRVVAGLGNRRLRRRTRSGFLRSLTDVDGHARRYLNIDNPADGNVDVVVKTLALAVGMTVMVIRTVMSTHVTTTAG